MTDDSVEDAGNSPTAGADETAVEDVDSVDESVDPASKDVETLVEDTIGDGRPKHVELITADGERIERGDVYLRYSADVFLLSADPEFPPSETDVYPKADLHRAHVDQHHSACFITTAVAGESETLTTLRGFRDDAMTPTLVGGAMVALYERISPPIAATLSAHPESRTTRAVRWLVRRCAGIADRREDVAGATRRFYTVALVLLYVVGICVATAGAAVLSAQAGKSD